jgi:hypothetical protein
MLRHTKKNDGTEANGLGFDYFKITKSKMAVNISTGTLREWHRRGLPLHKVGKLCFVSKKELEKFITAPQ